MKKLLFIVILFLFATTSFAASSPVRLKDIAHVLEARDNQLMGFGLVVGLKNTGDTVQTQFTKQALTNLLSRIGIVPQEKEFKSKNVAAVMVTAKLPPFINIGQKIDVTVSSMGDATSLRGGTLLMTPLQGPDDNIYAVAQGQLAFGVTENEITSVSDKRQMTGGRVINGAIVEKEVPVTIDQNFVTIVIDKPDYTTAYRIVSAMRDAGINARARDAASVVATKDPVEDMVKFISRLESLTIVPDSVARVVINEQTGVIVIGENVKVAPVAFSYGDTKISVVSEATLNDLVSVLNSIGVRPKDMVAIIQTMKSSGAISADIEVI